MWILVTLGGDGLDTVEDPLVIIVSSNQSSIIGVVPIGDHEEQL